MNWFLYDRYLRNESVNEASKITRRICKKTHFKHTITLQCLMSTKCSNTVKNLTANDASFLTCIWPFCRQLRYSVNIHVRKLLWCLLYFVQRRKQLLKSVIWKTCSETHRKAHWKTLVLESLFDNFFKKETLVQLFCCEFLRNFSEELFCWTSA